MAFTGDSIFWVEVEKVVANPFQPRREFDEAKLKELSESIRMYGVLQPLTVTRKEIQGDDGSFRSEYELIAGERRLRASRLAGLQQVPVIIRDGEQSEQEKLELAIIENLQREDLNAVDRALAFKQLAEQFSLSHAKVAAKVGRSREYVSNTMRLLLLPEVMLDSLKKGDISEGHARTLLMLSDRPQEQDTIYREILLKKLSVREVERITRKIAQDKVRSKKWKDTDPELIEIENKFTETLGTRVQISKTDYGGKLVIDYFSQEDLDKLYDLISREKAAGKSTAAATTAAVAATMGEQMDENDAMLEKLSEHTPLAPEPTPDVHEPADTSDIPSAPPLSPEEPAAHETFSEPVPEVTPAMSEEEREDEITVPPEPDEYVEPSTADANESHTDEQIVPEQFVSNEDIKEKEGEEERSLYDLKNFGI